MYAALLLLMLFPAPKELPFEPLPSDTICYCWASNTFFTVVGYDDAAGIYWIKDFYDDGRLQNTGMYWVTRRFMLICEEVYYPH